MTAKDSVSSKTFLEKNNNLNRGEQIDDTACVNNMYSGSGNR